MSEIGYLKYVKLTISNTSKLQLNTSKLNILNFYFTTISNIYVSL